MNPRKLALYAAAVLTAGLAVGASFVPNASAGTPALAMLSRLDAGRWQIRYRSHEEPQSLCVRNGRELIQLRHPITGCSHFVVEDTADRVTVQYTCRGRGYGRTFIRRESSTLAQVESQGIVDGEPFDVSAEARLVGRCG